VDLPVVITDTFGRAWRKGLVDVAIGVSGLEVILDLRGTHDAQGRELKVTEVAVVDEIAAAADLAMGKAAGVPAALVRGLAVARGEGRAVDLIRPPGEDMFR
jgi:coenzyme F420-0:L-glutamate ligase/coenzyme F420-1:gamma-L-glutamate ligase